MANLVTASRYNVMQSKVAVILGLGSEYLGYGQEVLSSYVNSNIVIDDVHMNNLRTDMINAYVHQTGTLPLLTVVQEGQEITEDVWIEYEAIANAIRTNFEEIFKDTQSSLEVKLNAQRTQSWGGDGQPQTITHEFQVIFESFDQRRFFFNTGGEIRFSSTLTNSTGAKSGDWESLLSGIGIVKYDRNGTSATTGDDSGPGHLSLTEEYQDIYFKTGSGIYVENTYAIKAKASDNIITFAVEFYDGLANFDDDPVNGRLTSSISQLRATGSYVEVPSPIYKNLKVLS